jgi:sulfite reductase beta subunit-like hemoprotein
MITHRQDLQIDWFEKVSHLLQKLIVLRYLPVNLVQDIIVQEMTNQMIPSRKTMNKKIHQTYLDTVEKVKLYLQTQRFVCLVLDEWTHFQNSYIGIVAVTMEKSALLTIQIPASLSRSALVLKSVLNEKIEEFKINDKIVYSVTDCAAVMQKHFNMSTFHGPLTPVICSIQQSRI